MQRTKGISLIVLVITIIVMIILAGAIIITLNNSGIMDKANEAVEQTDLKQMQSLATTLWGEAYIDYTEGKITEAQLIQKVKDGLKEADENYESKYTVTISKDKVIVQLKGSTSEIWTQKGTVVTNTKTGKTVKVGDYIDYTATGSDYNGTWQILGAEKGELLIVSTENVIASYTLGASTSSATTTEAKATALEEAKKDYVTGAKELDDACIPYGNGPKVSSVRSIKVEDIDRVAEYDKTTFTYLGLMASMGEDTSSLTQEQINMSKLADYGREVTFKWDGTTNPVYSFKDGENTITGSLGGAHNTFTWYDADTKVWRTSTKATSESDIVDDEDNTKVAKITNDMYAYLGANELKTTSVEYDLLFGTENALREYWLASPYAGVDPHYGDFGVRHVLGGGVNGYGLVDSSGDAYDPAVGVRAVVSLESDIQLSEGTSANSWIIANK